MTPDSFSDPFIPKYVMLRQTRQKPRKEIMQLVRESLWYLVIFTSQSRTMSQHEDKSELGLDTAILTSDTLQQGLELIPGHMEEQEKYTLRVVEKMISHPGSYPPGSQAEYEKDWSKLSEAANSALQTRQQSSLDRYVHHFSEFTKTQGSILSNVGERGGNTRDGQSSSTPSNLVVSPEEGTHRFSLLLTIREASPDVVGRTSSEYVTAAEDGPESFQDAQTDLSESQKSDTMVPSGSNSGITSGGKQGIVGLRRKRRRSKGKASF